MLYDPRKLISRPLPLHITSTGPYGNIGAMSNAANSFAFGASNWPANNRAVYCPVHLPSRFTIARFMLANGTSVSGNFDMGIYDDAGTRLLSTGAVAQSGTNVVQYAGVTDQSFPAGHYYLALVLSSTGGETRRVVISDQYQGRVCGLLQEALGSTVLPTTMTGVSFTNTLVPCFGFTQSDTL
jgi:hypothetical protein